MPLDHALIAQQWVRSLRGRRSQVHLGKRLGYRSNALYTWEAGIAFPPAHRAFGMAQMVGVELAQVLPRFFRDVPPALEDCRLDSPEGVTALVVALRGRTPVNQLAKRAGVSRFTLSRWLNGRAQPKLDELFAYVAAASLRLLDFIALWVDPADLPGTSEAWERLQRARHLGYEHPASHAVLRALETTAYAKTPTLATLGGLLRLPEAEVAEHLQSLLESAQVHLAGGRYCAIEVQDVDFRRDRLAAQQVKTFWAKFAAERTEAVRPGLFAYNLFAVSRSDLAKLEQLQRDYLREMRSLIAASEPSEVVALFNVQLLALEN